MFVVQRRSVQCCIVPAFSSAKVRHREDQQAWAWGTIRGRGGICLEEPSSRGCRVPAAACRPAVSWLTGRAAVRNPPIPLSSESKGQRTDTTPPVVARSMDEYNWSGFSCPYCNSSSIVRCGKGHLTCDGTTKLRDGNPSTVVSAVRQGLSAGGLKQLRIGGCPLKLTVPRQLQCRRRLRRALQSRLHFQCPATRLSSSDLDRKR
jgi:hypothetical protein